MLRYFESYPPDPSKVPKQNIILQHLILLTWFACLHCCHTTVRLANKPLMDNDNKQISESLSYSICCLPPTIPHCHTQDPDLKIETPNSTTKIHRRKEQRSAAQQTWAKYCKWLSRFTNLLNFHKKMNLELDLLFWALVVLLWSQQDSLLPEPPRLSSDQAKFPPASCCVPTLFDQWSELGGLKCLPLLGICYILQGILLQQQYPVNTVVFSVGVGVALWTLCYMMVRRQYCNLHQHLCVIILVAGNEQHDFGDASVVLWACQQQLT